MNYLCIYMCIMHALCAVSINAMQLENTCNTDANLQFELCCSLSYSITKEQIWNMIGSVDVSKEARDYLENIDEKTALQMKQYILVYKQSEAYLFRVASRLQDTTNDIQFGTDLTYEQALPIMVSIYNLRDHHVQTTPSIYNKGLELITQYQQTQPKVQS